MEWRAGSTQSPPPLKHYADGNQNQAENQDARRDHVGKNPGDGDGWLERMSIRTRRTMLAKATPANAMPIRLIGLRMRCFEDRRMIGAIRTLEAAGTLSALVAICTHVH